MYAEISLWRSSDFRILDSDRKFFYLRIDRSRHARKDILVHRLERESAIGAPIWFLFRGKNTAMRKFEQNPS